MGVETRWAAGKQSAAAMAEAEVVVIASTFRRDSPSRMAPTRVATTARSVEDLEAGAEAVAVEVLVLVLVGLGVT